MKSHNAVRLRPSRRIRYLDAEGIHPREIKGLDALDAALPPEWVFYAGLKYFPGQETPIEMDLVILMHDRVLLVEIKDWAGDIVSQGGSWVVGRGLRKPSPVHANEMKAKKLKSLLQSRLSNSPYVESCVVMTATATVRGVPDEEGKKVFSLDEAKQLGNVQFRAKRLTTSKLFHGKSPVFSRSSEFDQLFGNGQFRPQEADFDGYTITEAEIFKHPDLLWIEHRAQDRSRNTALLRCWDFSRLPPGGNSPDQRRFIAERERRAFAYLNEVDSHLADGSCLLRPLGAEADEIQTTHHQLLSLPGSWKNLARFLEANRETLTDDNRLDTVSSILAIFRELHLREIAHRDFNKENVWLGSHERVALSGLITCRLPNEKSVGDWFPLLRGYSPELPEDKDKALLGTGQQRDVYLLALLARDICPNADGPIAQWLERSLANQPGDRFRDAIEMADEWERIRAEGQQGRPDQSKLDRFESTTNPYTKWPQSKSIRDGEVDVWISTTTRDEQVVVKVWPGVRRGMGVSTDLALLRLMEGSASLKATPLDGFPRYHDYGLSKIGAFVVYQYVSGAPLDEFASPTYEKALLLTIELLKTVQRLHSAGFAHGDLHAGNVLVSEPAGTGEISLAVLDLFDLCVTGAEKRSPVFCPPGYDALSPQQVDRFSLTKIAHMRLSAAQAPSSLLAKLGESLERRGADDISLLSGWLEASLRDLRTPPAPEFEISANNLLEDMFAEECVFFVRHFAKSKDQPDQLVVTGAKTELVLELNNRHYSDHRFVTTTFRSLANANSAQQHSLRITTARAATAGFQELIDHLLALPNVIEPRKPSPKAGAPEAVDSVKTASFSTHLYWEKVLRVEEDLVPEIILTQVTMEDGKTAHCEYEKSGADFDFDPEDTIEVRDAGNGRKVGSVNFRALNERTITIEALQRPPSKGDRLCLVNWRGNSSFQRRRRAIERALKGQSVISNLVRFLDPNCQLEPTREDPGISVEEVRARYGLNEGQSKAFVHILGTGPLALLQGPPGTGKTRFIAALIHWLMNHVGVERVLLVSQSHEAVNAAAETIIDRYKKEKQKLDLLRIGTKGITQKILPFHTTSLREGFRKRFENALKGRVAAIASEAGVKRALSYEIIDVDRQLGTLVRRIAFLEASAEKVELAGEDERRRKQMLASTRKGFARIYEKVSGRELDEGEDCTQAYANYLREIQERQEGTSWADAAVVVKILDLAREWVDALKTVHRNFEEFLAKTRSIVSGTCVGVGETRLRIENMSFDWVIVDEAARCNPGELAVAAQLGRKVLLVGDQLQLRPMMEKDFLARLKEELPNVSDAMLTMSDFERAFYSTYGQQARWTLHEQYRMSPAISALVSETFYVPRKIALEVSPDREISELFTGALSPQLDKEICWIDTSRMREHQEQREEGDESCFNKAEIVAIVRLLRNIAESALFPALLDLDEETPIGVISMYKRQKDELSKAIDREPWPARFRDAIKIDTVDSYQGKENSIIILSLTRANPHGTIGHVGDPNRCNVAISRAKERLFIVGAQKFWRSTADQSPIKRVWKWVSENDGIRSQIIDGDGP